MIGIEEGWPVFSRDKTRQEMERAKMMTAYLYVTVGVPVHVIDDDGVGRSEINTEAPRLRRQQKDE